MNKWLSKECVKKRKAFLFGCLFLVMVVLSGYILFCLNPDNASKPIFQVSLVVATLLCFACFKKVIKIKTI